MRTTESSTPSSPNIHVRDLGTLDYQDAWQQMRDFTDRRDATTPDEIWLLEHPRVFTLGQAGLPEHVLNPGAIPIVETDRGGQVTYHGPGQLIAYVLIDLKRAGIGVRELVVRLELAVISLLADYGVHASGDRQAPGVYVDGRKIAALGLRIRKGCSYHGLSLNRDMDLEPFSRINPCGIEGLEVTSIAQVGIKADRLLISEKLVAALVTTLVTTSGNTFT